MGCCIFSSQSSSPPSEHSHCRAECFLSLSCNFSFPFYFLLVSVVWMLASTSAYFLDVLGYFTFPLKASFLSCHCLLPGGGLQASNLILMAPFLLSPTVLLQEAVEIYSMPALGLEVFQTLIKLPLSFQNKYLNKKRMVVTQVSNCINF